MGDSGLSASELRQRYHRGGTAQDDELSAKQLRARHAIPSNSAGTMNTIATHMQYRLNSLLLSDF